MNSAVAVVVEAVIAGVVLGGLAQVARWMRRVDHRLHAIERQLCIDDGDDG